jgi:hypothetical protein
MKQNKISLAKSYYQLVDESKLLEMYELFTPDLYYKRCEQEIRGIIEFKNFYEQQRKIDGKHNILNVLSNKNLVVVQGEFQGWEISKNSINLDFVDIFEFNSELKIYKRYTYLAVGFKMTK